MLSEEEGLGRQGESSHSGEERVVVSAASYHPTILLEVFHLLLESPGSVAHLPKHLRLENQEGGTVAPALSAKPRLE